MRPTAVPSAALTACLGRARWGPRAGGGGSQGGAKRCIARLAPKTAAAMQLQESQLGCKACSARTHAKDLDVNGGVHSAAANDVRLAHEEHLGRRS
jgi:hypothetical protein